MKRLDTTFQTLSASPNEAAISVLGVALCDPDAGVRCRAVASLAQRKEHRCGEILLQHWGTMDDNQKRSLQKHPGPLADVIAGTLTDVDERIHHSIEAAATLGRCELIPKLVDLAETHISHSVRLSAVHAIAKLADYLGTQARDGQDPGSIREDAIRRLAKSVEQISLHRNRKLVDAFLLASTSRDSQLMQMLDSHSPHSNVLLSRLQSNPSVSIARLLASFLRRPKLQSEIAMLIRDRNDAVFRTAILDQVGVDPTSSTLHHLRFIGPLRCLNVDLATAAALTADAQAAFLYAESQTAKAAPTMLRMAITAIQRGETITTQAASTVLMNLQPLDIPFWIDAAIELAGDFDGRLMLSANALLLGDLLDLLRHGDANVVQAVHSVLRPLHAESVMPDLALLDATSRQRLGSILMMIDPSAIDLVRDRLRHPVLKHRLEAIAAAESLGIVDLLVDSFSHVVRNDHQEARRRAAEAMANASSSETLALLSEMINMPNSSARDEAVRAYELRT